MTRFARAKGSKSSNQKAPEDSTPWEVMKEQIIKSKKENEEIKLREEAEKQRIDNYNNFLKEHKVQKRKATWCEFPEDMTKQNTSQIASQSQSENKKKKKKEIGPDFDDQSINNSVNESVVSKNTSELSTKQKKKKNKNKNKSSATERSSVEDKANYQVDDSFESNSKIPTSQPLQNGISKKKKNKAGIKLVIENKSEENHEVDNSIETTSKSTNPGQIQETGIKKKNKKKKLLQTDSNDNAEKNNVKSNNNELVEVNKSKNIKAQKFNMKNKDQKPTRRKAINDKSFQLIINGKEIELVRYDGFPIMKKDAERLEELKNNMIKKGIPKSEVQRTMKLERRRAEKALARIKREVCYNCRKGGHNLSDCPDLKSKIPGVDAAEGVCFKCGSTEHRQFECKVQRDKEFRFATCFICKEPGHIARQCPDNPKGLYPNGGSCKLCGDVTHLKKDCPTTLDKKEETSIKLQTLDDTDNIEDINQKAGKTDTVGTVRKPKKIKF